ncbi:hypothetical protein [Pandoraea bronchicola]|uniref:Curli assembly protein CsgG n=1 Tax=Pandoraea bronchicola TaxID=2508287 RepID=A0A5E5BVJ2_9BURK|nr:hypothetical protein [Pandoraea bronchicola]VVE90361.1 curli assembly protein CsgG [Pandoraea bronchicola]
MDFGALGRIIGSAASGSLGGDSNTTYSKTIEAAFSDSYNDVVRAVKNDKQQTAAGGLGNGRQLGVQDDDAPVPTKNATQKKKWFWR